jgi:hypothetical protein
MTHDSDVFVTKKITNNDIYQKQIDLEKALAKHSSEQEKSFEEVNKRLDFTNGKIKFQRWLTGLVILGLGGLAAALAWGLNLLVHHIASK